MKSFKEFLQERTISSKKVELKIGDVLDDAIYIGMFNNKETFISLDFRPRATYKQAIKNGVLPTKEMMEVLYKNKHINSIQQLFNHIKMYEFSVWLLSDNERTPKAFSLAHGDAFFHTPRAEFTALKVV